VLGAVKFSAAPDFDPPASIDWVAKGGVTPVKNQGSCGSCWSFSTTGALEGAIFAATGKLQSLSEENLVECDNEDHGCRGGNPMLAYDYVKANGLCAETDYPYIAAQGNTSTCHQQKACASLGLAAGVLQEGQEVDATPQALMAALAKQPVSIAIEADQMVFQHYQSGVLSSSACGNNLDHAVLAVGYGMDGTTPYWKVKNSWGPTWGEQGYVRFQRGEPNGGECGILKMATFPVIKAAVEENIIQV